MDGQGIPRAAGHQRRRSEADKGPTGANQRTTAKPIVPCGKRNPHGDQGGRLAGDNDSEDAMKDFLNNPVVQKLAMVLLAAALYIGGTYFPDVKEALQLLAASLAGGAMIKRPGDEKAE